ncbi:MAG: hypothetical protein ABR575_00990 [Actinomycetota bacterium]
MCSSHATVRGLLHELPTDGRLVVVDNEASPEHLSRSTTEAVDVMLVVAEPYFKSLETARRYYAMGTQLGIPRVVVVANKVRDASDDQAIREFCDQSDLELFGAIPFDESLAAAERAGRAPVDHDPGAPSVTAVRELVERVLAAGPVYARG